MRPLPILILALCCACGTFDPKPFESVPFLERAQTQTDGGITVTCAVPSKDEARALTGVKVWNKKIQPVWLRVENRSKRTVWMLPISVDDEYHPPLEVAYKCRLTWKPDTNRAMERHLDETQLRIRVDPGETSEGFLYTNLDQGVKVVNVDLLHDDGVENFLFIVRVPGMVTDFDQVEVDKLHDEYVEVDEQGLRKALEGMPRATQDRKGKREGDPLNIVVVGNVDDVFAGFVRRGWDLTEATGGASTGRMVWSFIFGTRNRYSPISPLHVFGRPQDVGLQKARDTIHQRNHLRLWRTRYTYEGMHVWIGQISRDIGIKTNFKAPTIVTHKIDADIDESRVYLLQDMLYGQSLKAWGYVRGVGVATPEEPRYNLGVDPYYTDGLRLVLVFGDDLVPFDDIRRFDWETPEDR